MDKIVAYGSAAVLAGTAVAGIFGLWKMASDEREEKKRISPLHSSSNNNNSRNQAGILSSLWDAGSLFGVPIAACASVYYLSRNPVQVTAIFPPLRDAAGYSLARVLKERSLLPQTRLEAFELGRVAGKIEGVAEGFDNRRMNKEATTLIEAARALGVSEITKEDLARIQRELGGLDKGMMERLTSIVNLSSGLRAIAATGIAVTTLPVLGILADKLNLLSLVQTICTAAYERIIVPLHLVMMKGGYEAALYFSAVVTAIESARYPMGAPLSHAGMMTAFTSTLLAMGAYGFTACRAEKKSTGSQLGGHVFFVISAALLTAWVTPLALLHSSRLLAIVSVAATGLLFGVWNLSFFHKFDHDKELISSVMSCAQLGFLLAAARPLIGSAPLKPFENVVGVISTLGVLLGLWFNAALVSWRRSSSWEGHLVFQVALAAYAVAGTFLTGSDGQRNAALMIGSLYASLHGLTILADRANHILAVFCACVLMYIASKQFQQNPRFFLKIIYPSLE